MRDSVGVVLNLVYNELSFIERYIFSGPVVLFLDATEDGSD